MRKSEATGTEPAGKTMRSRLSEIRRYLSATRLLILLAFAIVVTWLLVYTKMVDYLSDRGIDPDKVGHANIVIEVFDSVTVFFGLLVFAAAGVVPIAILFVRATPGRSQVAQILWAALIVALLLLARSAS